MDSMTQCYGPGLHYRPPVSYHRSMHYPLHGSNFMFVKKEVIMGYFKALVVSRSNSTGKVLNWDIDFAADADAAIEMIQRYRYDALAMALDLSETDSKKLEAIVPRVEPDLTIIRFDDETDLGIRLKESLRKKRTAKRAYEYLDNSFEIEVAVRLDKHQG